MDAAKIIDRHIARAAQTIIFEHPDHEHYVVLAHPGQPEPQMDPKSLRDNFGIMPAHIGHIKRLSESDKHRPRPLSEIAAERIAAERAALGASDDGDAAEPAEVKTARSGK